MGSENPLQSVWNFDDERLKDLNYRLIMCENALEDWDIPEIKKYLYSIKRILWGVLEKNEKEEVKKKFKELEKIKRKYDLDSNPLNLVELYNHSDEVFLYLGELRNHYGLEFRKKKEESGL